MATHLTHDEIRAEVARLKEIVNQVHQCGFGDDIHEVAQELLSDMNAAALKLLEYGEKGLPTLIESNDRVWRTYVRSSHEAAKFLEPLL